MKHFHTGLYKGFLANLTILIIGLTACTSDPESIDRVTASYPDGRPKRVVTLEIHGTEQKKISEVWFHDNGQQQRLRHFKDGYPHGEWKEWYSNGQLRMAKMYNDGELDGSQVGWYPNGEKMFEAEYQKGLLLDRTMWNLDGTVKSINP